MLNLLERVKIYKFIECLFSVIVFYKIDIEIMNHVAGAICIQVQRITSEVLEDFRCESK